MKRSALPATLLFAGFVIPTAHAQEKCIPIAFAPGHSTAIVKGIAPFGPPFACYTVAAGLGQTATIKLTRSNGNMAFNIDGVVDNRDNYSFKTEARTYKIDVYQITREQAVRNAQFEMQVTLK
jgi:hypothetical protein